MQAFKDPLSIKEYLERNMPLSENDLVLWRFSAVDYGQPLAEAVIFPYNGCPFSTGDGEAMKRHQQETRHPGWGRYEEKPIDKKWICPKEVCGASFLAWDHLYHCNRSVSSFSLPKRGVITAGGTNSRENSFSGRGASGIFWWTKDVFANDSSTEKESCLSKTGYDLPLFFSGICHYLYY